MPKQHICFIKSIKFRTIDSPVIGCGGVQREALTHLGENTMEHHCQNDKEHFEVNENQCCVVKKDHSPDANGDQTTMINFCYELLYFLSLAGEFPKGLDPFFAMSLFNSNNAITSDEFWYKCVNPIEMNDNMVTFLDECNRATTDQQLTRIINSNNEFQTLKSLWIETHDTNFTQIKTALKNNKLTLMLIQKYMNFMNVLRGKL